MGTAARRWRKWLSNYSAVSSWLGDLDLEAQLQQQGGLVKINDFLPPFVADGILALLEGLPAEQWNLTAAGDDYAANNIRHHFLSTKSDACADVFRLFTLLLPDSLWTFSAAKYECEGHIVPHDDRAYTQVRMEDGQVQLCSRRIAVIYYLTRDWAPGDGGALIDHEAPGGPVTHVPAFNSLVAFTIPRWHEVAPVTAQRPRYSIFGWFLEPGKLYDLNTSQQPAGPQQPQQLEAQQAPAAGRKRKRKQQQLLEQQAQLPQPVGPRQPQQLEAQQTPAAGRKRKRKQQQQQQQQLEQQAQPPQPAGPRQPQQLEAQQAPAAGRKQKRKQQQQQQLLLEQQAQPPQPARQQQQPTQQSQQQAKMQQKKKQKKQKRRAPAASV